MAHQADGLGKGDGAAEQVKDTFYVVDWLDESYQQLAIPNPTIQKLVDKLSNGLAAKIKGNLDKPAKQQALFMLLGRQYMKQHFSSLKHDPAVLEPPRMAPEMKMAVLDDMRNWLRQQLYATSHELGYDRSVETGSAPAELEEFQQQSISVYKDALKNRIEQLKSSKKMRNTPKILQSLGHASEAMGEALLAVGVKDPFEMAHILKALQKNCYPLPSALRSYIWREYLFLRQGVKYNVLQLNIAKEKRTYFKSTAERNSEEFKQVSPFESPINSQINDAVIEIYDHTSSLQSTGADSDSHLLEAVKVLNALYSYNQIFNPLYIYWLCPLQFALERDDLDDNEWLYHLAFHLEFFIPECPLSHAELFSTADQVLDTLKSLDPYLHEHLLDTASKHVTANPKDFPEECYHLNRSEAKNIFTVVENFSGKEVPSSSASLIGDPAIFIRKWLATVFVSTVSPHILLLFWDLIFLSKWDRRRLHDICLVLLGLLKTLFYTANNYSGIRQVFFEEGSKLYTADIRRAWIHFQNQGPFEDITNMNSNSQNIYSSDAGGKRKT